MILFLAKLGRFYSVLVNTLVAVLASFAATMVAVTLHAKIASS